MKSARWTAKDLAILEARQELIKSQSTLSLFSTNELDIVDDYTMMIALYKLKKGLFFPGNVPSLKNSREIIQIPTKLSVCCNAGMYKDSKNDLICTSCDRLALRKFMPKLGYSKPVQRYISHTTPIWVNQKDQFTSIFDTKSLCTIGLYFIRDSKRAFDYHNAEQIIGDLMVTHKYIEDDNTKHLRLIPIGTHVNASHAGVLMFNLSDFDDLLYMSFKRQLMFANLKPADVIKELKSDIIHYERLIEYSANNPNVIEHLNDIISTIRNEIRLLSQTV